MQWDPDGECFGPLGGEAVSRLFSRLGEKAPTCISPSSLIACHANAGAVGPRLQSVLERLTEGGSILVPHITSSVRV
jgi:hypothetical protein